MRLPVDSYSDTAYREPEVIYDGAPDDNEAAALDQGGDFMIGLSAADRDDEAFARAGGVRGDDAERDVDGGVRVELEAAAEAPVAGGHDNVIPPGGDNGRGKRYGGGEDPDDGHEHGDREEWQPQRPGVAEKVGEIALEVGDPRTEAARFIPEHLVAVDAKKALAARYKAASERPNPFRTKNPTEPDFSHMGRNGASMAELVSNIRDPGWKEPLILYPKERVITAAHKDTLAAFGAVNAQIDGVDGHLGSELDRKEASVETTDHRTSLEMLDEMHAELVRAAERLPSAETCSSIVDAYEWLVGTTSDRILNTPAIPLPSRILLPKGARLQAHVAPLEEGLDRAKQMGQTRALLIERGSGSHETVNVIARIDAESAIAELLDVLEQAKAALVSDTARDVVRERGPDAARYLAAETHVVGEVRAALKEMNRLDPTLLKDGEIAKAVVELQTSILAGIAEKAQTEHEATVSQNLSRGVTRARDMLMGTQRVLGSMAKSQRRSLGRVAEGINGLAGTPDRPGLLSREEAGVLFALTADPDRFVNFHTTVGRVQAAVDTDEALQLVERDRARAIEDLRQVDVEELVGGLWDKLGSSQNQLQLRQVLTEAQLREARFALGRYLDPEYDEPEAGSSHQIEPVATDDDTGIEQPVHEGEVADDGTVGEEQELVVGETPRSIDEIISEFEIEYRELGFTVLPVGEHIAEDARREAEAIVREARERDPTVSIDMDRVTSMVQFARAWQTTQGGPDTHLFIARGQLGNRGTVRTESGRRVRDEYLVLVMLNADSRDGSIRQRCWADSPIAERNASYVWDSSVTGVAFPDWERIFNAPKQVARNEGGARALKHTAPGEESIHVTMMQRVWSLLTGPSEEFYRDTRYL